MGRSVNTKRQRTFSKRPAPKYPGPSRPAKRKSYGAVTRVRGETGYVDYAAQGFACDSTGSVTLLNAVGQGASTSQRIGKRISLKSVQLRGSILSKSATKEAAAVVMFVYDKRPTGSMPSMTDILVSSSAYSFNNDTNSSRFRILKRTKRQVIGNETDMTSAAFQDADAFLNLKGLPVTYKDVGTGAIGDIEEGALYMVTIGDKPAGNEACELYGGVRLRYNDV